MSVTEMIKGDVVYEINKNQLKTVDRVVKYGENVFITTENEEEFRLPWQFLTLNELGNIYGNLDVQQQVLKYKK